MSAVVVVVLFKNPTESQFPLIGIIHQFEAAKILDHGAEHDYKPENGESLILAGILGILALDEYLDKARPSVPPENSSLYMAN